MNISPKAVRFDDDTLWVSLSDGRTIAATGLVSPPAGGHARATRSS
jgi:hypothetical protein